MSTLLQSAISYSDIKWFLVVRNENSLSIKLARKEKKFREEAGNLLVSCADVLHRISNLVISRRCLKEDGKNIDQNQKRKLEACT